MTDELTLTDCIIGRSSAEFQILEPTPNCEGSVTTLNVNTTNIGSVDLNKSQAEELHKWLGEQIAKWPEV